MFKAYFQGVSHFWLQAVALVLLAQAGQAVAAGDELLEQRLRQQFAPILLQLQPQEPSAIQGESADVAPIEGAVAPVLSPPAPIPLPVTSAGFTELPLQALAYFYAQRQYRPLWVNSATYASLISALEALSDDGLEPEDYFLSQLYQAPQWLGDVSAEGINQRYTHELMATSAYLRAVDHLYRGKLDPESLAARWQPDWNTLVDAEYRQPLLEAPEQHDIARLFTRLRPQYLIYNQLLQGLKDYRHLAAEGGWPALESGASLKPCMSDSQVAVLRQRLSITGEYRAPIAQDASIAAQACAASGETLADESQVYDAHLVEAVKRFQRGQYLDADGAVGPATRAALNVSVHTRLEQIMVNLDRARSLMYQAPSDLLLVDIAGFKVTYYKARQPIWRSRVQVGMSYRTTPLFHSAINVITLNPGWTVPPTIYRKDILPRLRRGDLQYLRDSNIRVFDRDGRELNPAQIDWQRPGGVTLRQDPGPKAALGRAAIRFPNPHAVYLHDTPHQRLFEKSQRAFSSGCIRVERVMELVQLLLMDTPGWGADAIEKMLAAGKTLNVRLAQTVPILLAYWTVDVDEAERLVFKPDIYTRDSASYAALKSRR